MYKRRKMGRHESRRDFVRKSGVHPKNGLASSTTLTVRGGIKL